MSIKENNEYEKNGKLLRILKKKEGRMKRKKWFSLQLFPLEVTSVIRKTEEEKEDVGKDWGVE